MPDQDAQQNIPPGWQPVPSGWVAAPQPAAPPPHPGPAAPPLPPDLQPDQQWLGSAGLGEADIPFGGAVRRGVKNIYQGLLGLSVEPVAHPWGSSPEEQKATALRAQSEAQLIGGTAQAATPLLPGAAAMETVPTAVGLTTAWLASKLGGTIQAAAAKTPVGQALSWEQPGYQALSREMPGLMVAPLGAEVQRGAGTTAAATGAAIRAGGPDIAAGVGKAVAAEPAAHIPGLGWLARWKVQYPAVKQAGGGVAKGWEAFKGTLADRLGWTIVNANKTAGQLWAQARGETRDWADIPDQQKQTYEMAAQAEANTAREAQRPAPGRIPPINLGAKSTGPTIEDLLEQELAARKAPQPPVERTPLWGGTQATAPTPSEAPTEETAATPEEIIRKRTIYPPPPTTAPTGRIDIGPAIEGQTIPEIFQQQVRPPEATPTPKDPGQQYAEDAGYEWKQLSTEDKRKFEQLEQAERNVAQQAPPPPAQVERPAMWPPPARMRGPGPGEEPPFQFLPWPPGQSAEGLETGGVEGTPLPGEAPTAGTQPVPPAYNIPQPQPRPAPEAPLPREELEAIAGQAQGGRFGAEGQALSRKAEGREIGTAYNAQNILDKADRFANALFKWKVPSEELDNIQEGRLNTQQMLPESQGGQGLPPGWGNITDALISHGHLEAGETPPETSLPYIKEALQKLEQQATIKPPPGFSMGAMKSYGAARAIREGTPAATPATQTQTGAAPKTAVPKTAVPKIRKTRSSPPGTEQIPTTSGPRQIRSDAKFSKQEWQQIFDESLAGIRHGDDPQLYDYDTVQHHLKNLHRAAMELDQKTAEKISRQFYGWPAGVQADAYADAFKSRQ